MLFRSEASNFKVLYDALLLYRFRFLRVYQILADGNPPENIPKCENKDGGLIKMFLDNIPFEYGTRLHRELPSSKYAHIEDYLVDFFDQVKLDFNAYRTARRTNDRFGGTVVAAKQVTSTTIGTPQYRTAPTQQTGQRSGTSGNQQRSGPGVTFANQRPQQRLHMIQDAVTDSDVSYTRSGQQQPDLTTADEHDLRLALQHDSNSSAEDEIDQTHDEVAAQIDTHSAAVDTNDYDTPMYVPEDSDVDLDAAGVSSPRQSWLKTPHDVCLTSFNRTFNVEINIRNRRIMVIRQVARVNNLSLVAVRICCLPIVVIKATTVAIPMNLVYLLKLLVLSLLYWREDLTCVLLPKVIPNSRILVLTLYRIFVLIIAWICVAPTLLMVDI